MRQADVEERVGQRNDQEPVDDHLLVPLVQVRRVRHVRLAARAKSKSGQSAKAKAPACLPGQRRRLLPRRLEQGAPVVNLHHAAVARKVLSPLPRPLPNTAERGVGVLGFAFLKAYVLGEDEESPAHVQQADVAQHRQGKTLVQQPAHTRVPRLLGGPKGSQGQTWRERRQEAARVLRLHHGDRHRRPDEQVLELHGEAERVAPLLPVADRLPLEVGGGVLQGVREGLVGPEDYVHRLSHGHQK
mmetsp:Transcript_37461/g.111139  ORF Transcript_37461/g.111139 Transcript_37461/m.111139 type:complete len:244 (+) Transcript_37461:118-849(+)